LKSKLHFHEIDDEEFRVQISTLTPVCFIIVTEINGGDEALVMHKHVGHINTMIDVNNLHSTKVRLGIENS